MNSDPNERDHARGLPKAGIEEAPARARRSRGLFDIADAAGGPDSSAPLEGASSIDTGIGSESENADLQEDVQSGRTAFEPLENQIIDALSMVAEGGHIYGSPDPSVVEAEDGKTFDDLPASPLRDQ